MKLVWPWHIERRRTAPSHPRAFDDAMTRWQESARLWDLAQQHGTRPAQIADADAHDELDAANVRALYQQTGPCPPRDSG